MTNFEWHLLFLANTHTLFVLNIVCLDSPHQEQHLHMCRSPWVPLVAELCHYDLKLTTHHTCIKHTHHAQHKSWDLCFATSIISISSPTISATFPLPHLGDDVSFVESNNGRRCDLHPDGCGNSLVLERDDHGVGMELWLRMKVVDEMACYTIKPDGTDGCRISFLAKEYTAVDRRVRLNGVIVRTVKVLLPDNPNRMARRM